MKKLTQEECAKILNKWLIPIIPEYRAYTCAGCGQEIVKAWHIHCLVDGFKREFHLCKKCGGKYGLTS